LTGLDTWALTDAAAFLFDRTPFAFDIAVELSSRRAEFEKRLGFSMMAGMAVHRKELADDVFLRMLPVIRRESCDDRNFVRKAVNWALRQIGKRNSRLRRAALAEAKHILSLDTPPAIWIAKDAIREFQGKKSA
jgi:3-methyladenine DNA glycosylase AlkD